MKRASWIILVVAAGLTLLGALASLTNAYFRDVESLGGTSVRTLAGDRQDVVTAAHARRATAASYAAGFAVLLLAIAVGPYRRGDVWAWWAILSGALTFALLAIARVAFLGTWSGAGTALVFLVVIGIGLALDPRPLRAVPPASLPS